MAPSAEKSASPLRTTLELLAQGEDICRAVSVHYAARHGPLIGLLRQQAEVLGADLHCLTARISNLRPSDGNVTPEVIRALASTKHRLFELLELQHLHTQGRKGDDGALDALFARRFILGDSAAHPDATRAYYDEDKLTRIGLELKDLLQEVLPASVRRGTFYQDGYQQFV